MKNFLLLSAIVVVAACNENATHTENRVDSTADAKSDSLKNKAGSLGVPGDSTGASLNDSIQQKR